MAVCFVLGIAWLTVWYIAQPSWMVGGNINLGIGFGLLLVGFALATKWE